jgi:hypothetical protein
MTISELRALLREAERLEVQIANLTQISREVPLSEGERYRLSVAEARLDEIEKTRL